MRSSTRTKKADASPRVSLRFGQKLSGAQPRVIPAASKASIADSAQCPLSSANALGTFAGQPQRPDCHRSELGPGQKPVRAESPWGAAPDDAFGSESVDRILEPAVPIVSEEVLRGGRKAHHTMEEGGRLTSGDGSVRAGQAVPASEEEPSGMQFGEGGPEEARVVVLERVHATDAAMRRHRHLIDDEVETIRESASRHRSRRCATYGGS